jgi:hypothetical protein
MAYVHPEDIDAVAAQRASQRQRPVECETCGRVYVRGEWRSE